MGHIRSVFLPNGGSFSLTTGRTKYVYLMASSIHGQGSRRGIYIKLLGLAFASTCPRCFKVPLILCSAVDGELPISIKVLYLFTSLFSIITYKCIPKVTTLQNPLSRVTSLFENLHSDNLHSNKKMTYLFIRQFIYLCIPKVTD